VPVDIADDELQRVALAEPGVQVHIAGKTVRKVVVAKGRLVSVVVG
jgi:leucyl-tRNA synthetase